MRVFACVLVCVCLLSIEGDGPGAHCLSTASYMTHNQNKACFCSFVSVCVCVFVCVCVCAIVCVYV